MKTHVSIDVAGSGLGPKNIPINGTALFTIKYVVSDGAPQTAFSIDLAIDADEKNFFPKGSGRTTSVSFTVNNPPFVSRVTIGDELAIEDSAKLTPVVSFNPRPRIEVVFDDSSTAVPNIDQSSVRLYVDGATAPWTFGSLGSLTVVHVSTQDLIEGRHQLRMFAQDMQGAAVDTAVDFYIQSEQIVLFDESGVKQVMTTVPPDPETGAWIRATTLLFSVADPVGISKFEVLQGPGPVFSIAHDSPVLESPKRTTVIADGPQIDDSPNYYIARLTNTNEESVERYFLIDRRPPITDLTAMTVDTEGQVMRVSASATDEGSGMASIERYDAIPQEPLEVEPALPHGSPSAGYSSEVPPGSFVLQGRDVKGKLGLGASFSLDISSGELLANSTFTLGNGGHVLRAATVAIGGFTIDDTDFAFTGPGPTLRFCGPGEAPPAGEPCPHSFPPDIGVVRLSVASSLTDPGLPFDLETYPPTAAATIIETDRMGPFRGTFTFTETPSPARRLAPIVTWTPTLLANSQSVSARLMTVDPQGQVLWISKSFPPGTIRPSLGDVNPDPGFTDFVAATYMTAYVRGVDGTASGYRPVSTGVNTFVTIPPIEIEFRNVTGDGNVSAGEVPAVPPGGFLPTSKTYDIEFSVPFEGPARVRLPHNHSGGIPPHLKDKANLWRFGPPWTKLVSVRDSNGITGETANNSLYMLAVKDAIPPYTALSFGGATVDLPDGSVIVSTRAPLAFVSNDPAGHEGSDDVDTGVRSTYYKFGVFASTGEGGVAAFDPGLPINMAEGTALLSYASVDWASNVEIPTSTVVRADGTPPTSSLSIAGPMVVEPSRVIVGPQTLFTLSSIDPISNGVSAGTAAVAALIDETVESCGLSLDEEPVIVPGAPPGSCGNPLYSEPFAVGAGTHTLGYFALDNVLNAEALRSTVSVGDYAAPSIVFKDVPRYTKSPSPAIQALFSDTLAGVDVSSLVLSLDGAPLTASVVGTGGLEPWQAAPPLQIAVAAFDMAYLGNRLYAIGGHDGGPCCNEHKREVFVSPLADGAPSAWTRTADLPGKLAGHSAVALGGRLYTLGGSILGAPALNTVYFATPDPQTGLIASWTTAGPLPQSLGFLDAVGLGVTDKFLYALGGRDGGGFPHDTVYFAPINATTGAPGTWTLTVPLPVPLAFSDAVEHAGRIYIAGGVTGPAAADATARVLSIATNANGTLQGPTWRDERAMPTPLYGLEVAVLQGRLYVLGGQDRQNIRQTAVHSAAIDSNGTLGEWRSEDPLHRPLVSFAAVASQDALYYAGGDSPTGRSPDVRWSRPSAGDLSSVLVTAATPPLTERTYTLAARGADRVANSGSFELALTVDFSPPTLNLTVDGAPLSSAAIRLIGGAAPTLSGRFIDATSGLDQPTLRLLLDGIDVTALAQLSGTDNDTQAVLPSSSMAPGIHTFEARGNDKAGNTASLTTQFLLDPQPPTVALSSPVAWSIFGGEGVAFHADFSDTLSGLATGTLLLTVNGSTLTTTLTFEGPGPSGWQTAPSLDFPLHAFELVHLGGRLYSLGGHAGAFQTPNVYVSPLIDGVPQGWTATQALPQILAGHSAAVLGARIYTLGGSVVGAPAVNKVFYTQPDPTTGLIASWTTAGNLPQALGFLDAVGLGVADAFLYAVGGRDGGGFPHNTVYFAPINAGTGAPGTWNQTVALPVPLAFADAVEHAGRIYVAGGVTGPSASDATDRIFSIAANADGTLQGPNWRDERALITPLYSLEVAVLQGRLYVLGGLDRQNVKQTAVRSAPIASDGTLGEWRSEESLHRGLAQFATAASQSALYYAGGDSPTGLSAEVRFMTLAANIAVAHASASVEGLAEGIPHSARAQGADLAGNTAFASVTFHVDLTAPETLLVLHSASTTAPGLVVAPSGSALSLEPRDFPLGTNAGVTATFFAINGTPTSPPVAPSSMTLANGSYVLDFWSVDALGHAESTNTIVLRLDPAAESAAAPDGTASLTASVPVEISTVATENAPGVFKFAADAQGLTLVLDTYYELSGGPFSELATLSFYFDPTGLDPSQLSIFTFDGTSGWSSGPITGQTFTPISDTLALFTGQLTHTSIYALMRRATSTETVPPAVAFAFPRADEPGLCRLAQGPVAVRGSAADENLSAWRLTQASLLLGSGTANTQGTLGTWDATGLSGPYTLALSAQDSAGNTATASLAVQAGSPARTLALGGKQVLNKPRGVAAGPNRVYIADTNADRVRVFDAAGAPLAVLGDKKGTAKLNKPAGLNLDAAGNILVADANNKRVVKLSPAGVFLAEYGKGVLQRPVAVALSAGRLVVADAKAGQLVVFSDTGALLTRVDLPPAAGLDEDPEEPRPVALAADAAGHVWVADAKGGKVLRYTPELTLAQTIPGFKRPEGVAVSPSGSCLAVSDSKASRIRTFDAALSAGLAAFGAHGEIKENKALPAEFLLNKPAHLAFDAQGTLLVADRNNDLVQGFGLPGTPLVIAMGTPGRSGGGTRLAAAGEDADEIIASARVGHLEGGRVEHPDGAVVEVPAGAITEDLDVAVAKAADSGDEHRVREAARGLAGLAAASGAREFSPHGLSFREPAVITLPYDPLLVAAPRDLKIHYWNEGRGAWEALASTVDEGGRTVSAQVAHFSVYQVLAPASAISTMADPDAGFAFRAIYAFPNPAVGGQRPTVHMAVGRADKVVVRFYDVAGTPVHEATLDAPSVVNDESGPHLAYEYAWTGHIPSGVYLYAVTAEKAGHAPIKRVGKLAVVR